MLTIQEERRAKKWRVSPEEYKELVGVQGMLRQRMDTSFL